MAALTLGGQEAKKKHRARCFGWILKNSEGNFFQHFNSDFPCRDFAQRSDRGLIFALNLGRMALAEHAGAVGGGKHQLKAIGDLLEAIFNSNSGHGVLSSGNMECREGRRFSAPLGFKPQSLCMHYRFQIEQCRVK
jgi:hypothetical protein